MASQIISLTIVHSTVCSSADQRKHQSSTSRDFVSGIHRSPMNSPHKGPVTRKLFPFDDVIMINLIFLMSDFQRLWLKLSCHEPYCDKFWLLLVPSFTRYSYLKIGCCPKSWLGKSMSFIRTYNNNFTSTLLSQFLR